MTSADLLTIFHTMSIQTIVAVGAGLVTVAGGAVATVRHFRVRHSDVSADLAGRAHRVLPLDFELIPIRFEVALESPVPQITVTLHAVNYSTKPITVTSVRVRQLRSSPRGSIDEILAPDSLEIPPHQSHQVYPRRALYEAEAALFRGGPPNAWLSGSCTVVGVARRGGKEIRYEPLNALTIDGTVL